MLLDFAKNRRLRVAASWIQIPEVQRWTWYFNSGGARKEIHHVLVGGRWRFVQNCRVFRSAEFAVRDHRFLVAIQPISAGCPPALGRGRCPKVAARLAESLGARNDSDNPKKLWTDFKTKVVKVSQSCQGDTSGTSKSFPNRETPNSWLSMA